MSLRYSLTLLALLIFQCSLSQDVVYLDYDLNQITETEYKILNDFKITWPHTLKTDSVTYKKIGLTHRFGKLTKTEFEQLKIYLSKKSKITLDYNEVILIAHIDSLHNYSSYVKNFIRSHPFNFDLSLNKEVVYSEELQREFPNARLKMLEKDDFIKTEIKKVKNNIKCKERIQKQYSVKIFYSYSNNYKTESLSNELCWIPDNGIIKSKFFPFENKNKILLIKPDGEYFLSQSFNHKLEKALLKSSNWENVKNALAEVIQNNPIFYKDLGIFVGNRKYKCFR